MAEAPLDEGGGAPPDPVFKITVDGVEMEPGQEGILEIKWRATQDQL